MLRIVTDGAADVPTGWEKEFDIQLIPINIHELIITELSVAVAANLGPGTVGLIVYPAGV